MGDADHPLDIGFLVEAMLFYDRVDVVASRAGLGQLVRTFGPELLLEFLVQGHIAVQFERNFTGVVTENAGTSFETCLLSVAQIERQGSPRCNSAYRNRDCQSPWQKPSTIAQLGITDRANSNR